MKTSVASWFEVFRTQRFDGMDGRFVHAFMDRDVMAGNGTIALELIEAIPGTVWHVGERSQLHHFGLYVDSVQAAIDELGPGMALEMAGLDRDGMLAGFCYVNDALGVRMELVERGGLPPLDG